MVRWQWWLLHSTKVPTKKHPPTFSITSFYQTSRSGKHSGFPLFCSIPLHSSSGEAYVAEYENHFQGKAQSSTRKCAVMPFCLGALPLRHQKEAAVRLEKGCETTSHREKTEDGSAGFGRGGLGQQGQLVCRKRQTRLVWPTGIKLGHRMEFQGDRLLFGAHAEQVFDCLVCPKMEWAASGAGMLVWEEGRTQGLTLILISNKSMKSPGSCFVFGAIQDSIYSKQGQLFFHNQIWWCIYCKVSKNTSLK